MTVIKMKAYTYIEKGRFELLDKPKPELQDPKDAIVRVTMSSICSSDLHIKHGQTIALVGETGSGKSTIMKLISAELKPTEGSVHVNGYELDRIRRREIPYLRRTIGVIFQDFRLIENMTVYENVAFAMRIVGAKRKEIRDRVPYVLRLVGLEGKAHRKPNEISGGEQQRLAIARALVNNPSTIIADEPTGNLDAARALEIMRLLQEINKLGTTVVVVTHQHELVEQFSNRVIVINNGYVVGDRMAGAANEN